MIEELSLEEELIDCKNGILEYLNDISKTINESFKYFEGPWNDALQKKYNVILNDLSNIKTMLNNLIEDNKI